MADARAVAALVRAEGWTSIRDRLHDRLLDRRDRARYPLRPPGSRVPRVEVLTLLSTPPWRRLGGVQLAFLHRRRHEGAEGQAVLFPEGARYRLEISRGGRRAALSGPPVAAAGRSPLATGAPPPLADEALASAIRWAAAVASSRILHVENLATLPPATLWAAGVESLALVLSLHDFGAFCPRPHLFEMPHARFCEYSRDPERCRRCLSEDWRVDRGYQAERRATEQELLGSAVRLVFTSEFLRRTIDGLYVGLDPGRQEIVEPALDPPDPVRRRDRGPIRKIAFVGGTRPHKGGGLLADVVERCRRAGREPEGWWVFGAGADEPTGRLRDLDGVRVRGYYAADSLPALLARHEIDLAILPSIVPESFSLTLRECWLAGCPVIAFDRGAVGERLRRGGGRAIPAERGAAGLADAVLAALAGHGPSPPPPPAEIPSAAGAAAAYRRIFEAVGAGAA